MAEVTLAQVFTVGEQSSAANVEVAPLRAQEWELKTYLTNLTPKFLRILEQKFWHGRAVLGAPHLASGTYGVPRQRGALPEGVKWGIAYTDGEGSQDTSARKWIVAFDTAAKKAYAEVGPMGPIDWNVVEVKLSLSTDKVEYVNQILGGKARAEIELDGLTARGVFS